MIYKMILKQVIDILKENLVKEGLDKYVDSLTFFTDGIYGTYDDIGVGFCSKKSKGRENTKEDFEEIIKVKFCFEYKALKGMEESDLKEIILNLPEDRICTFFVYNEKRELNLNNPKYISYLDKPKDINYLWNEDPRKN